MHESTGSASHESDERGGGDLRNLRAPMPRRPKAVARFGMAGILLGSTSAAILGAATPGEAATGIGVFVGYADSVRAAGEFPNPWDGSPNVTFDGCTPSTACTFDAGTVRVENDRTSSVMIDQLSVHIGACLYTWSGPRYPVTLAPGASLVTTQRSASGVGGCTGPDPSDFDTSDIPSVTCIPDGILPVVDVTVDGITTSSTDTGQVLNTGGVDPARCVGSNESTEWVPIGSKPCPGQTLSLTPATQTQPVGTTATVSATFKNVCGNPLSGVLVKFKVIAGPNGGVIGSGIADVGGTANFTYSSLLPGTDSVQASVTNSVGFTTASNTVAVIWTVQFAPGGGGFVIGNQNAVLGNVVNFWGSQWAKNNFLSGGPAPRSFKGFAEEPFVPMCGRAWTADPGNSTPPPDGPLPALMGVIVTSSAHQTGSAISGDILEIVIVKTNTGYEPNPGHGATGTVVGVVCGGPQAPARSSASLLQLPANNSGNGLSNLSSAPGTDACPSVTTTDRSNGPRGTRLDAPVSKGRDCSQDLPRTRNPRR